MTCFSFRVSVWERWYIYIHFMLNFTWIFMHDWYDTCEKWYWVVRVFNFWNMRLSRIICISIFVTGSCFCYLPGVWFCTGFNFAKCFYICMILHTPFINEWWLSLGMESGRLLRRSGEWSSDLAVLMILGGGVTGPDVFMAFMSILAINYYYLLSLFIFCIHAMA